MAAAYLGQFGGEEHGPLSLGPPDQVIREDPARHGSVAAYVLASTDNTACTTMPGTVRQASRKDSQSSDVLRCEPIGGDLLRRWLLLEALALALALARARALALARARALALARARALALARAKAALALARARALAEHARHGALRRRSVCQ